MSTLADRTTMLKISEPHGSPTPETTPEPELSLALSERERAWSERVYREA